MPRQSILQVVVLAGALLTASASPAAGAAGELDTTFGSAGTVTSAVGSFSDAAAGDSALQPDGKLVVVGSAATVDGHRFVVARYLPHGAPDASFGSNGKVVLRVGPGGSRARGVALSADGRIIVAGTALTTPGGDMGFATVRLRADGTRDPSFGAGGDVVTAFAGSAEATAVAAQPDGKVVVAGHANGSFAAVRYRAEGTLDPGFGSGGKAVTKIGSNYSSGGAHDAALQPDGKIVLAGGAYVSGESSFALVRYDAAGAPDPTFGINGQVVTAVGGDASGLAIQPDGRLVVVGDGESSDGNGWAMTLARYLPTGTLDPGFGSAGVARHDFDYLWMAADVALDAAGRMIVVGSRDGGARTWAISRHRADGSLDPMFGFGGVVVREPVGREFTSAASVAVEPGGAAIVSGRGADAGGAYMETVRLGSDGTRDSTFGAGGRARVDVGLTTSSSATRGLALPGGKTLVAGGRWGSSAYPSEQGLVLAQYLPTGDLDSEFGDGGLVTREGGSARAVVRQADGKLVVAANQWGPPGLITLRRFDSTGADDPTFGTDGVVAHDRDSPAHAWVSDMATQPDGKLVVAASRWDDAVVMRYLPDGTPDASFGDEGVRAISEGERTSATVVRIQPDGRILVGGQVDGRPMLARYTPEGTLDPSFGSGGVVAVAVDPWGDVQDLELQPDGKIVAVGRASGAVALRFRPDGSLDPTFGSAGRVQVLHMWTDNVSAVVQADGRIAVAGSTGYCCVSDADSDAVVVRVRPDGSRDTGFGDRGLATFHFADGHNATAADLLAEPDGNLVVVGRDYVGDAVGLASSRLALARLNGRSPPPDTTITSKPADPTNSAAGRLEFTSSAVGAAFECRLDDNGWTPCSSPYEFAGLREGPHSFAVRAVNDDGTDATPAVHAWTVDLTAPRVSVTAAPPPLAGDTATFEFAADEPQPRYSCTLDGVQQPCSSPTSYSDLGAGAHLFEVQAVDPAGNVSASASHRWEVSTHAAPGGEVTLPPADQTDVTIAPPAVVGLGLRVAVLGRRVRPAVAQVPGARPARARLQTLRVRGNDRLVVTATEGLRRLAFELRSRSYRPVGRAQIARRADRGGRRWVLTLPRRLGTATRFLTLRAYTVRGRGPARPSEYAIRLTFQ